MEISLPVKVAIATENQGKIQGVKDALEDFGKVYSRHYELTPCKTDSGVSDTPLSDDEGIQGCINRLASVKESLPDMDLYIAVEGVLAVAHNSWFVRGWTMIEDPTRRRTAIACGSSVQIPDEVAKHISPEEQFSETVKTAYQTRPQEEAIIRNLGANGLFSDGPYKRRDSFYDGTRICLAQLMNERNWTKP